NSSTPPFQKYYFQRPPMLSERPLGGGTAPVEKHYLRQSHCQQVLCLADLPSRGDLPH
ncbi:hypothetical protein M9458_057694, partial [Cirrhinus mrigala]